MNYSKIDCLLMLSPDWKHSVANHSSSRIQCQLFRNSAPATMIFIQIVTFKIFHNRNGFIFKILYNTMKWKQKVVFFLLKRRRKKKLSLKSIRLPLYIVTFVNMKTPLTTNPKQEKKTLMKKENNNCYGNHMRIGVRKKNVQWNEKPSLNGLFKGLI